MNLTFEKVKGLNACEEGLEWFVQSGCTTVEATISTLLKTELKERHEWSNWLLSRVLTHTGRVRYVIFAAELVLNIYEKEYPNDNRPRKAIEAAKEHIDNPTADTADTARAARAARAADAARADVAADADDAARAADAADADYYAAYAASYAAAFAARAANAARADAVADAADTAADVDYYAVRAADAVEYEKIMDQIITYGLSLINPN